MCDELLGPMVFNTVDARAKELGGSATINDLMFICNQIKIYIYLPTGGSATMLTEFGLCYPSFDNPEEAGSIECNFVLGKADSHFQSW